MTVFSHYHGRAIKDYFDKIFLMVLSRVLKRRIQKILTEALNSAGINHVAESCNPDKGAYNIAIGLDAQVGSGNRNITIGGKAGHRLATGSGSDNLLIGDYADVPDKDTNNFVNIANVFCFYKDTGIMVPCPKPYKEEE